MTDRMMALSHLRGNPIVYNGEKWAYVDGGSIDEERPCVRCGRMPTPEGHDACLGEIEDARAACCGHGVEDKYVIRRGE